MSRLHDHPLKTAVVCFILGASCAAATIWWLVVTPRDDYMQSLRDGASMIDQENERLRQELSHQERKLLANEAELNNLRNPNSMTDTAELLDPAITQSRKETTPIITDNSEKPDLNQSSCKDTPGLCFRDEQFSATPVYVRLSDDRRQVRVTVELLNLTNEELLLAWTQTGERSAFTRKGDEFSPISIDLMRRVYSPTKSTESSDYTLISPGSSLVTHWTARLKPGQLAIQGDTLSFRAELLRFGKYGANKVLVELSNIPI